MKEGLAIAFCVAFFVGMLYIARVDKSSKQEASTYIENLKLDHSDAVCREPEINNELH